MPHFSNKSNNSLKTCVWDLQQVFQEVVKYQTCTILNGYKSEEKQTVDFSNKISNKEWPDGEHNTYPSKAVDAAPFPIPLTTNFKDRIRFYQFAAIVKFTGKSMGIDIHWRGDDIPDTMKLEDLVHFEVLQDVTYNEENSLSTG